MSDTNDLMEKIVALCKRRGFIYPGSEIYGGLANTYDYGPVGTELLRNIKNLWWKNFVQDKNNIVGLDASLISHHKIWEASGHVSGFHDPLVTDAKTKKRYRADHLLEEAGVDPSGMSLSQMGKIIEEKGIKSPDGNTLSEPQQFNMMFKTSVGSVDGSDTAVYLRPETAQGMFVNFKNIIDAYHPKLPFGIAQIGRSFRNEIAPRDFIFRVRELEIMELEYFFPEREWEQQFEYWQKQMHVWFSALGFSPEDIKEVEIPDGERAHYSRRTVDFHFKYPHKFDEIGGLAYRTDFDLRSHIEKSGIDLAYLDPGTNEKSVPHVLEPTFGLGRHVLAVRSKAYSEDEFGGEKRVFLKFPSHLAPINAAVFPLLKNKPELVGKAREIFSTIKREIPAVVWDDNGNIGKRYRRQDEIGTPYCITIDFDTLENGTVTLRDRDSGEQERVAAKDLVKILKEKITQ